MLRAVLFALAAFYALRSKGRLLAGTNHLQIIEARRIFVILGLHLIVELEGCRDIHTLGAGHAVTAGCTAYFDILLYHAFYFFDEFEIILHKHACGRIRSGTAVLLYHLHRIHAG